MIHHEKIKAVSHYLESEFSKNTLGFKSEADRGAQSIILSIEDATVYVTVLDEFLEDNKVDDIKKKLQAFRLKEFIRHGWSKRITVTRFGLKLEDF